MEGFKLIGEGEIANIGEYAREYIKKYPDVRIYVGCDSANRRKYSLYGITVCFRHPGNGVHITFKRVKVEKIRDMFSRLWKEVEFCKEVGEYLETELKGLYLVEGSKPEEKLVDLDLDLNKNVKWKSNRVLDAGVGYLTGLGFRVRSKPTAWASSCAADMIGRKTKDIHINVKQ